ncbi:hypothetical protein RWV98_17655 [Agathobaculum sp. NTUH-O15-33]|uniref:hypothetical protein n=1 Tax=Agathobaculum sp. NTUH-O15-33 TaxID=3079302 RepID=UPI002958C984|nr:hypothetical protein [Agathobaculum sp. NTUH-O15-33]WNX84378.1 hypothetical protein RWV98_17655 [Agathobaculum sp. NTUH-O15-33]
MNNYYICSDLKWSIFCEENPIFSTPIANLMVPSLAFVKQVFERSFGEQRVNSLYYLSILPTTDCPQSFKKRNLIFLSVSHSFLQLIYQFSHELCHLMIPDSPTQNIKWLEETFCELASLYSLLQLKELPSCDCHATLNAIRPEVDAYVTETLKKAIPLNGLAVSDFIKDHINELENDPYIRSHNATVARELFPIFRSHPNAWKIIPHLCEIPKNYSFDEGIHYLSTIVENECRDGMDCIASLLLG